MVNGLNGHVVTRVHVRTDDRGHAPLATELDVQIMQTPGTPDLVLDVTGAVPVHIT